MSEHYRHRLRQLQSLLEPGLRRMFLLSLVLHLIVPLILSGVLKITHKTPQLPVYRVNLVNLPVKNPRAGRPDAAPKPQKKPAKPVPKEVPIKPAEPAKAPPVPVKQVPAKPAAAPPKPDTSVQDAKARDAAMAALRAKLERQKTIEDMKAAIAAQQQDLGKPVDAPVGEPEGTGDEIGISDIRFVEGFIKEQWRLSEYQLPRLDLQAEVKVIYSAEGMLRSWDFIEKSGNALFDDSIKRAILKSRQLNYPLPTEGEFEIVFNLKDLQNR